jgi:N6-adenosine-specific RNA methylase IME4
MKYQVIYADPPWQYTFPHTRANPEDDYPTMPTSEICKLPVGGLAADNCTLFMWAIWNKLDDALKVIEAWGFRYVTCAFVWVKTSGGSRPFWGMGAYTRQNAEICLLGVRGKPSVSSHSVHQVIMERVREHSRKPDAIRNKIIELVGDVSRVELFARQRFQGWDVWGNEVPVHTQTTIDPKEMPRPSRMAGFEVATENREGGVSEGTQQSNQLTKVTLVGKGDS